MLGWRPGHLEGSAATIRRVRAVTAGEVWLGRLSASCPGEVQRICRVRRTRNGPRRFRAQTGLVRRTADRPTFLGWAKA